MIKTQIVVGIGSDNRLVFHPYEGMAVNMEIAEWLFQLSGWAKRGAIFPFISIATEEEEFHIPENAIFFHDKSVICILGIDAYLN